ncbi:MAG: reverse transcriptase family protein [Cytophagales bacterium]|nr:reverse transcriptase family protein [Cytophagales bacterium]
MNFPRNLFIENARREGHSEKYLNETLEYIDTLIDKNLPVIFSLRHFAQLMGQDYKDVKRVIENRKYRYSYYLIKKKKSGFRRIIAPHKPIKYLQDWIKINILDKTLLSSSATGFVKGKSILDNARVHVKSEVIINLDLENFFEHINERRVYGIFYSLGYSKNLSVEFAKICTVHISQDKFEELSDLEKGYFEDIYNKPRAVLVQGASTSPCLSNLICKRLDYRLSALANKHGINYSRYADDLTFSGDSDKLPSINLIKKIIKDEDFNINWNKYGKYKNGQRQMVTGLLVNEKIRVPKKYKKEIYRHLFFCKKYGALSHFNRISPNKGYRKEWLLGKILFVNSIEPDEAKKMFELVKQINWEI